MTQYKPVIIPRPQHNISRSQLSPNAIRTLYRLKDNGFIAYLVGGCVRDLLLGREPKDFDVVTNATPGQLKRLFRNCRLIGRRFRLAHLHFQDEILEVSTFRSSATEEPADEETLPPFVGDTVQDGSRESRRPPRMVKDEDGMVLRDNIFGTPEEDALRRDFTVNALFYNIADFSIIDYVGGIADINAGMIHPIGDPSVRFTEDPVRMLRAVRFAALLGFEIEGETHRTILAMAETVSRATPPRLYEECLKLFLSGAAERTFQMLRQTGLFSALFPHYGSWLDAETDGFPHTMCSRGLEWLDTLGEKGDKASPQLLLALMFGQYLEELCAQERQKGIPPHTAINMAVARFMEETAVTVRIPSKTGMQLRDILSAQQRFRKTPGKQPLSFIGRPCFAEALEYLRFTTNASGEEQQLVPWWEKFVSERLTDAPPVTDDAVPAVSRRPKRRRRRKPRKVD